MWKRKPLGEFIDTTHGQHVVTLHNTVTGHEHKVQALLHPKKCVGCGSLHARSIHELDMRAIVENELAILNESHKNMQAYSRKHGVPLRGK